jgi:hypothetical protein
MKVLKARGTFVRKERAKKTDFELYPLLYIPNEKLDEEQRASKKKQTFLKVRFYCGLSAHVFTPLWLVRPFRTIVTEHSGGTPA